ncbi:MAG TPA: hypothetical protein VGQ59_10785, partial [Cyclobacteriaceae bacterium]|nr:hypothetical protein [Cyclobacteriaceae bacterium]
MSKTPSLFEILKSLFQLAAILFCIPSFFLFFAGCFFIAPPLFKPLIHGNEFVGGQLVVDSVYICCDGDGGDGIMYSAGHINNIG